MKTYVVYTPAGDPKGLEKAEFVEEGFSWIAFIFALFWALYHRMWWLTLAIMVAAGVLTTLNQAGLLSLAGLGVLRLGGTFLIGLCAPDLRGWSLKRRGYVLADIVTGHDLVAAQQRFFDSKLGVPQPRTSQPPQQPLLESAV